MKPALSPQITGLLPTRASRAWTSASTGGSVTTVRTISTRFCTGAGLKKWTPTTRPGLALAVEISVTESEEVLVARIASGRTISSSRRKISFLTSSDSTTASTTKSASLTSSIVVVNEIRPSSSAWSSSLILPRATARPVECSRWPRPRSTAASSTSTPTTVKPSRAKTSAMPAPIVPRPITPMVWNSRLAGASDSGLLVMAGSCHAPSRRCREVDNSQALASGQVDCLPVRLVVARCQVDYAGRLTAHLPMATRVLMLKADGSVLVHSDGGSYKPLNWMSPPCTVREAITDDGQVEWVVTSRSDDTLRILFEEVHHDSSHDLGVDPGLQKDGVEKHLQELLAEHPESLADGLTLVRREFPTAIGPVDLMCRDSDGLSVAVEIKRRGEIDGVEQLTRYLDLLNRDPALTRKGAVRGIFAAQEIKPQARVLATDRGIACAVVDYDALRGIDNAEHRLF